MTTRRKRQGFSGSHDLSRAHDMVSDPGGPPRPRQDARGGVAFDVIGRLGIRDEHDFVAQYIPYALAVYA